MLDVFRFAWFAARTFFGVIALVLALYGALWVFVKVHSAAMGDADPDAALKRVKSYNAHRHSTGHPGGGSQTRPGDAPARQWDLLDRSVAKGFQHGIHPGLVPRSLRFEPFKHVRINAKSNRFLPRGGLEASPNNPPNNVPNIPLRVFFCQFDSLGSESS
jgi:hypothetical protein